MAEDVGVSSSISAESNGRQPSQVLLSFSGGKDSSMALHVLRNDPNFHVVGIMVQVQKDNDRVSVHEVRRELLDAQVAALPSDLTVFHVCLPVMSTNCQYEGAIFDCFAEARQCFPLLKYVAYGDIFLADVRDYRMGVLARWSGHGGCPLLPLFPLWGRDTTRLARDFLALGFRAHLVCVDTTQLDATYVGRQYDAALLDDLPAQVDPCGEKGEFHTFVSAGPVFSSTVPVQVGHVESRGIAGRFAYCDLVPRARVKA
ncbi:hypothetical protein NSK_005941 [Nannochloropsis salina CCMP1776]|uniref:Diphthine--ammonia ligase n=1 Tax=Nannochloropsis salina CCMP1776 TaxID=1027361 RepID=A0A4D9D273_9STRA|nr:hypothetical protein NSK_005941 [Nannochloropsis salina CCMP1776]|eukprot:TFJ82748.1 hypothetical protein NSK_005941 [Nannochloropsis salina CCMP1776]